MSIERMPSNGGRTIRSCGERKGIESCAFPVGHEGPHSYEEQS